MGIVIFVGLIIIIAGPLIFIWSLNTLFGLAIAYTFKTWLAALLIGGVGVGVSR